MTRSLKELREWMREGMPIEGDDGEVYLVRTEGCQLTPESLKRIEEYMKADRRGEHPPVLIMGIDHAVAEESHAVSVTIEAMTREVIEVFRLPEDMVVPPHHSSCRCTLVRDDGDDPSE